MPCSMRRYGGDDLSQARVGEREVWFNSWHLTPIYSREKLRPGSELDGPAIIEQLDTTTVLEPGDRLSVDAQGNLLIDVKIDVKTE